MSLLICVCDHIALHVRADATFQSAADKHLEILNQPINHQAFTDSSVRAMSAMRDFLGIKAFMYIYRAKEKMYMILYSLI